MPGITRGLLFPSFKEDVENEWPRQQVMLLIEMQTQRETLRPPANPVHPNVCSTDRCYRSALLCVEVTLHTPILTWPWTVSSKVLCVSNLSIFSLSLPFPPSLFSLPLWSIHKYFKWSLLKIYFHNHSPQHPPHRPLVILCRENKPWEQELDAHPKPTHTVWHLLSWPSSRDGLPLRLVQSHTLLRPPPLITPFVVATSAPPPLLCVSPRTTATPPCAMRGSQSGRHTLPSHHSWSFGTDLVYLPLATSQALSCLNPVPAGCPPDQSCTVSH